MAPGLYETPLTEELQARVERTGLQATSKPIPAERRDVALSGSVQRTLREHLNALPEAPRKTVYATNELLRQIAGPRACTWQRGPPRPDQWRLRSAASPERS